jgi:hypothetical protein
MLDHDRTEAETSEEIIYCPSVILGFSFNRSILRFLMQMPTYENLLRNFFFNNK